MSRSPRVVLAVSGGIACYKACEVVRRLRDHGAVVRVAMSRAATQFVGPTTFAALSGEPVVSDLFDHPAPHEVPHVRWAEWGDLLCVAPCTADFLARMAHGIADDFPSTLHLAFRGPTLVAPAMEDDMYRHPAVQRNLRRLVERGVTTVGPNSGPLASGRVGPGRMAEPGEIVATARRLLAGGSPQRWLDGRKVVITAGPTRERIDPIRFLSNRSSGKMGFALAREARLVGGAVTLVHGPGPGSLGQGSHGTLAAPSGVRAIAVESAAEMRTATLREAADAAVVVMAAAVADFTPAEISEQKIKKNGADSLQLRLQRTVDILAELGGARAAGTEEASGRESGAASPLLVGFAAESEALEKRALDKLRLKGCDLIVANQVVGDALARSGIAADDNEVVILGRDGSRESVSQRPKGEVAVAIWDAIRRQLLSDNG